MASTGFSGSRSQRNTITIRKLCWCYADVGALGSECPAGVCLTSPRTEHITALRGGRQQPEASKHGNRLHRVLSLLALSPAREAPLQCTSRGYPASLPSTPPVTFISTPTSFLPLAPQLAVYIAGPALPLSPPPPNQRTTPASAPALWSSGFGRRVKTAGDFGNRNVAGSTPGQRSKIFHKNYQEDFRNPTTSSRPARGASGRAFWGVDPSSFLIYFLLSCFSSPCLHHH